jgi:ornithine carbamoyltransferase
MTTMSPTRSFLRVSDLEREELFALLDMAEAMRRNQTGWLQSFYGQTLACYFTKPSTRTRVSFEAAAWRLGMLPVMLRPDELQLGRGEPLADTARVLSRYAAAIVLRTFDQADVDALAAAASVPVVNALTDDHHPCQALADLLTVRDRFGELDGLTIAYLGDGNNVAHSLMEAAALAGMNVMVASPPGFEPDPTITACAAVVARKHGGSVHVTDDPWVAVRGAHAVYTDVWVSMGQDAERDRKLAALAAYQVDRELMAHADDDAIFLHCLPAHRGEEVTAEVIDGPRSAVWDQAGNRLPTEEAVLYALISGRWS